MMLNLLSGAIMTKNELVLVVISSALACLVTGSNYHDSIADLEFRLQAVADTCKDEVNRLGGNVVLTNKGGKNEQ